MQLKIACLAFFSEDDIFDAKEALCKCVSAFDDVDIQREQSRRVNSNLRTAREATLDDIMSILHKLGSAKGKPTFLVDDVSRIPATSPEAGGSLMVMMEEMASLKREVSELQHVTTNVHTELQKHDREITALKGTKHGTLPNHESSRREKSAESAAAAPLQTIWDEDFPSLNNPTAKPTMAEVLATTEGEFIEMKRKKKTRKPRPERIQGTADATGGLKAGPNTFKVQLTNVHSSVTENNLREYVKGKNQEITILNVEDKTSEGWDTKRFIVTFDSEQQGKVMEPSFWPPNIFFRRWFSPRSKLPSRPL